MWENTQASAVDHGLHALSASAGASCIAQSPLPECGFFGPPLSARSAGGKFGQRSAKTAV